MKTNKEILDEIHKSTNKAYDLALVLAARLNEEPKSLAREIAEKLDVPKGEKGQLWYPKAIKNINGIKYRGRGKYTFNQPQGAVNHYSATRGGNCETPEEARRFAIKTIEYLKQVDYGTVLIDSFGFFYQNMPLDEYCPHAGRSLWLDADGDDEFGSSVNNEFVGIDINCAGRLVERNGKYYAWWDANKKNPKKSFKHPFDEKNIIHVEKQIENIDPGAYEMCTNEQFITLTEFHLWLDWNFDRYNIGNVAGHDEVRPAGKSDPGASLQYNGKFFTGQEYRDLLEEIKEYI